MFVFSILFFFFLFYIFIVIANYCYFSRTFLLVKKNKIDARDVKGTVKKQVDDTIVELL